MCSIGRPFGLLLARVSRLLLLGVVALSRRRYVVASATLFLVQAFARAGTPLFSYRLHISYRLFKFFSLLFWFFFVVVLFHLSETLLFLLMVNISVFREKENSRFALSFV